MFSEICYHMFFVYSKMIHVCCIMHTVKGCTNDFMVL